MKKTADLPTSIPELQAMILAQLEEIESLKAQYRRVLEQFKLAQQRKFARSSESSPLQLELFLLLNCRKKKIPSP